MKYKYCIFGKEDVLNCNGLKQEIENFNLNDPELDWTLPGTIDTEDLAGSKVPEMLQLVGSEEFNNLQKGETIEITRTVTEVLILEKE